MAVHEAVFDWYARQPGWAQNVVQALIVIVVGAILIGLLHTWIGAALKRSRRVEETVRRFLLTIFQISAWIFVGVAVLYVFGVSATALAGLLAAAGFILGFAVKDSLGNIAAGVTLLLYRPFYVDDVVTIGDATGKVIDLGLAMTTVRLKDARLASLTNGEVLSSVIINHTREPTRMADVDVGISYDDDIQTAIKAILDALEADPRVLPDPKPDVRITALADNSVNLNVRPWVKTADIWVAKADFHRVVKKALEDAGCSIPYPQRDVHMTPVNGDGDDDGAQQLEATGTAREN